MQGTNAHALLEVLDLGSCASVFNRSLQLSTGATLPVWQRASYWLAPPVSQLLSACLGKAGSGSIVLQGRLQAPALAALVRAAGGSGGWAVAAEAACAAAASLAPAADSKQQLVLGLADAAVASAISQQLMSGTQMQAVVDAKRGTVAVAVDSSQQPLLAASIVASTELAMHAAQQCSTHRSQLLGQLLRPDHAAAAAAYSTIAAAGAQHAQHVHGLFAQPALLQAGSQLQLLSAANAEAGQAAEPTTFDCLLPVDPRLGASSASSGGANALVDRHSLWHSSACQRTLRLSAGSRCSMQLSGVQWRQPAAKPAAAAATALASGCSYVASWQSMQPEQAACAASYRRQAAAVIAFSGQLPGRNGRQQRPAAVLPHSRRSSLQAGEAACFRAMQAFQAAAASGACALSLSTVAAAEMAAPAPQCSSGTAQAASSAALFAMLRCVGSELPDVACSAGSIDIATSGSVLPSIAAWDATFGCHGQQRSAGQLLAARLLPEAAPPQPTLDAPAVQPQQWAVSGGTGSLGVLVAAWLQLRQAGRLLLLGRSGRLAGAAPAELLADSLLSACMCDAAMQADAAAALSGPEAESQPLAGLVHAGGVLRDAALQQQTAGTIRAVHASKTAGLARLMGAVGHAAPLHQALLFSSIAAVTGPAGSSNYAAANAALDAAAGQLQLQGDWLAGEMCSAVLTCASLFVFCPAPVAAGSPCTALCPPLLPGLTSSSVQWGAWASIGMVASNTAVHRAMHRSGVGMLQPQQGLAAMRQLLDSPAATPQLAAIPFVWSRFMQAARDALTFFYGEHLQHTCSAQMPAVPHPPPQLAVEQPAALVPSEAELLAQVLAAMEAVHGSEVEPQQPLLQAGLDSLGQCGG